MEFNLEQVSNFGNANDGTPFANRLAHVSELFIFHGTQWLVRLDRPSQYAFFKGREVYNKPCQGALHHGTATTGSTISLGFHFLLYCLCSFIRVHLQVSFLHMPFQHASGARCPVIYISRA